MVFRVLLGGWWESPSEADASYGAEELPDCVRRNFSAGGRRSAIKRFVVSGLLAHQSENIAIHPLKSSLNVLVEMVGDVRTYR